MNKNKMKIAAAFSSFALIVISLTGVTIAWFAIANDVQVSNLSYSLYDDTGALQFGLRAPEGKLEALKEKYKYVSDPEDPGAAVSEWVGDIYYFRDAIQNEQLIDFGQLSDNDGDGRFDTKLSPCTAAYKKEWFKEDITYDEFNQTRPVLYQLPSRNNPKGNTPIAAANVSDYFYQFEIYLRSTNTDVFVFVNQWTDVVADAAVNKEKAKISPYSEEELNNVKNYIRVSFYSYLDYDRTDKVEEIQVTHPEHKATYAIYDPCYTGNYASDDFTYYYGPLDVFHDGLYDVEASKYEGSMNYYTESLNSEGKTVKNYFNDIPAPHHENDDPSLDKGVYREMCFGEFTDDSKIMYKSPTGVTPSHGNGSAGSFGAVSWGDAYSIDVKESYKNGFDGTHEEALRFKDINTSAYYRVYRNALAYTNRNLDTKVVVSVWAEGWDTDCSESSNDASFEVTIKLGGVDAANFDKIS